VAFSALGTVLVMVASLVPTFTASQAALLGSFLSKDERSFLTVAFSVNTANFIFSFLNFLATGRRRNGIVALMSPLPGDALHVYFLAALFVALSALLYGEGLARVVLSILGRIPYRTLNAGVLLFLVLLSLFFDGPLGLLVLSGASLLGLLAVALGVKRTNCMGVLMLQVMVG
jgi:putative membrane protein